MANKDIIQITDRFHLIKGLSEALNEWLRHNIPKILIIDKIESNYKIKTLKEKFIFAKKAIETGILLQMHVKKTIWITEQWKINGIKWIRVK